MLQSLRGERLRSAGPVVQRRSRIFGAAATLAILMLVLEPLRLAQTWVANQQATPAPHRRSVWTRLAVEGLIVPNALLAGAPALAAADKKPPPPGFVYEVVEPGTTGTTLRDGPPRSAARVWARFSGHLDSFTGEVFDSSYLRGQRKPSRNDYVEITVDGEGSITKGVFEALKLMKVGEKGRFVQPPALSYDDGKGSFEADEDSPAKGRKILPNTTLYYDVELVRIIRP